MIRCLGVAVMVLMLLTRISGFQPTARVKRQVVRHGIDPSIQEAAGGLLVSALRRAQTTISDKTSEGGGLSEDAAKGGNVGTSNEGNVGSLLTSAAARAQSTLDTESNKREAKLPAASSKPATKKKSTSLPSLRYGGNPAVTNTALAHCLWSSILRPNIDSAIDATCGNGYDSIALATMIFEDPRGGCNSELLCIDIQQQACDNTTAALAKELDPEILERQVQVMHASHAPLPRPKDSSSVGIICYNLGYLPNSDKDCMTKMESTLISLVDALFTVRIGGMVSVITYPKSNADEGVAVRTFLECASLLSSNVQTWQEFLEILDCSVAIKHLITQSMERVVQRGDPKQTWRVSEHKKIGMDRAPILLTATRIK